MSCRIQELVAASPGERNWRGIFIALLVIAAVLGLIVFSIFLLSPGKYKLTHFYTSRSIVFVCHIAAFIAFIKHFTKYNLWSCCDMNSHYFANENV